jgi:hypothetical protein
MRSSSVAPRGKATLASHSGAPLFSANAVSLPPAWPANKALLLSSKMALFAQGQGRQDAAVAPALFAAGAVEQIHLAIIGSRRDDAIDHRRGQDFCRPVLHSRRREPSALLNASNTPLMVPTSDDALADPDAGR